MKPAQVFILLLIIDLFLYYGAGAMGSLPDSAGNRSFSVFGNVESEGYTNSTSGLTNPASTSDTGLIPGTSTVANFLGGIIGLANWMWSVVTMPFSIGGMVGLSGPALMIPAILYVAMLVFAIAQIISGRVF